MPPRIALPLTDSFLNTVSELTGHDAHALLEGTPYALVTLVSVDPFEMNLKLTTEDDVVEEVQNDPDIQIIAF